EHVLVEALLPGPVLGQVDLEFGESRDDDGRHLLLAGAAVAADELLDRAGGIADEGQALAPREGSNFVEKDVQEGGVPVLAEEGAFDGYDVWLEVVDHPGDDVPGALQRLL